MFHFQSLAVLGKHVSLCAFPKSSFCSRFECFIFNQSIYTEVNKHKILTSSISEVLSMCGTLWLSQGACDVMMKHEIRSESKSH